MWDPCASPARCNYAIQHSPLPAPVQNSMAWQDTAGQKIVDRRARQCNYDKIAGSCAADRRNCSPSQLRHKCIIIRAQTYISAQQDCCKTNCRWHITQTPGCGGGAGNVTVRPRRQQTPLLKSKRHSVISNARASAVRRNGLARLQENISGQAAGQTCLLQIWRRPRACCTGGMTCTRCCSERVTSSCVAASARSPTWAAPAQTLINVHDRRLERLECYERRHISTYPQQSGKAICSPTCPASQARMQVSVLTGRLR